MEVEVKSREIIKPSIPTLIHLRYMQLSFFDQINYQLLVLFIYFYTTTTNFQRSQRLKKSLVETLIKFYPFAGRLKEDDLYVDCNDQGVDYFETHVKCKLIDLVKQQDYHEFNKLLLYCKLTDCDAGNLTLVIQLNFFDCGGIAIGACFSHKIADTLSFFIFFNSWTVASRGDTIINCPCFDLACCAIIPCEG
ncbi:hypothetical protein TEA_021073 [Camellia sinensis var. sinensis]|uniref:Uncharacterized protein n=1 Tax=Camellia sinensis var. sinensis TaxID=542762 RepID=A0A4S4DWZ6_CAMSN|nr:hypothetical protein TEA_021073 [Camellia sinensis var. sinensis]